MERLKTGMIMVLSVMMISSLLGGNLIPGDTSGETEETTLLNGPYGSMIWGRGSECAHRDTGNAFDGRYSIKAKANIEYSIKPSVPLVKGKEYTFSFYAKGSRSGIRGMINCARSGLNYWPPPPGSKPITYTGQWQRYSCTFKATHSVPYVGIYRVEDKDSTVWFDAFQLEEGGRASEYAPRHKVTCGITLNEAPGWIFYDTEKTGLKLNFRRYAGGNSGKYTFTLIDQSGKEICREEKLPEFDKNGCWTSVPEIGQLEPGWYNAEIHCGEAMARRRFVLTRKPVPFDKNVLPYSAFCNMYMPTEVLVRLGQGWRNYSQGFEYGAAPKDHVAFWGLEQLQKDKAAGLYVKLMININPPKRLYSQEERVAQKAHRLSDARFVPGKNSIPDWHRFMKEIVEKFGPYVDIWEFGGELDARFGLNPYYKNKYPEHIKGPFVTGPVTDQVALFTRIGADYIRKRYPKAGITAVRPCDVDCRSNFIFSSAVYEKLNSAADCFGLDSYAHPRRIGKNEPVPGEVTSLIDLYKLALKILKKSDPKADYVMISEYGYELKRECENDLKYQNEFAACYAQSNLMGRAAGFKSLAYYTGLSGGGVYDNWRENEPLASVAAVCHISRFLRNVDKAEFVMPADDVVIALFGRTDGSAGGAIFTCNPENTPEIITDVKNFTDIYGRKMVFPADKGMTRVKVQYSPVLFSAGSYGQLQKTVRAMKLISSNPLQADFRMRNVFTVKLYLSSRLKNDPVRCLFRYQGKTYEQIVPAAGKVIVNLPVTAAQKKIEIELEYPELGRKIPLAFELPAIHRIPRLKKAFPVDAAAEKWQGYPVLVFASKDLIYPIDVFSWYGENDLSVKLNLGHDGKYLYLFAAVKDDFHCNKYKGPRAAAGDHLQIAWDPLTNTAGLAKDKRRPDDTNIALALADGKPSPLFYYGPDRDLFRKSEYAVRRSEKDKTTYYELKIPLSSLGIRYEEKRVFGFAAVVFDDDSDTRWDYYMNCFPGITRGNDPSLYGQFVLE